MERGTALMLAASDGTPFSADDVVYTLNHVSNKDNAIANYALLA